MCNQIVISGRKGGKNGPRILEEDQIAIHVKSDKAKRQNKSDKVKFVYHFLMEVLRHDDRSLAHHLIIHSHRLVVINRNSALFNVLHTRERKRNGHLIGFAIDYSHKEVWILFEMAEVVKRVK